MARKAIVPIARPTRKDGRQGTRAIAREKGDHKGRPYHHHERHREQAQSGRMRYDGP
jgi:hypothetical protein